jgi:hypothetical protein
VSGRTDSSPHLRYVALRVHQKCVAGRDFKTQQVRERTVLPRDCFFRIGKQLERETLLRTELPVTVGGIHAHADDYGVMLVVLRDGSLEVVRFKRAATGAVFGVEVEHHPLAPEIMQADATAILRGKGEIRSGLSGLRNGLGENGSGEDGQQDSNYRNFHELSSALPFLPGISGNRILPEIFFGRGLSFGHEIFPDDAENL